MTPDPATGLLWYGVFLGSTVCHEAAHAWAGFRLGDDTAQRGGQMSLNPWPHIRREPFGMVIVPLISWATGGFLMGWASAPYNPAWAVAHHRKAALMAIAGPAANLALFLAALLLLRLGLEWHNFTAPYFLTPNTVAVAAQAGPADFASHLLSVVFSLNLLLLVFNLIPIPPLDGSNLPLLILPPSAAASYFSLLRSPLVRFGGLILILRGLGSFFNPVLHAAADLLYFGSHALSP